MIALYECDGKTCFLRVELQLEILHVMYFLVY